jgi:hypothetical protein
MWDIPQPAQWIGSQKHFTYPVYECTYSHNKIYISSYSYFELKISMSSKQASLKITFYEDETHLIVLPLGEEVHG